jgi:hypothetical protein
LCLSVSFFGAYLVFLRHNLRKTAEILKTRTKKAAYEESLKNTFTRIKANAR